MKKPPKRIPIAAARRYGQEYGQHQVIILSWSTDGRTHVVTWGRTKKDCQVAGLSGKMLFDYLFGLS